MLSKLKLTNYKIVRDKASYETDIELEWVRPNEIAPDLPRPIVLINGCFDVFHSGHASLIYSARQRAKTLVIAMDSDRLITSMKGLQRPIMTWVERATMLQYMPVDYLIEISSEKDMSILIKRLKPDFRCQGCDHKGRPTRFPNVEKLFVRSDGMRSSEIIRRIINRYNDQK